MLRQHTACCSSDGTLQRECGPRPAHLLEAAQHVVVAQRGRCRAMWAGRAMLPGRRRPVEDHELMRQAAFCDPPTQCVARCVRARVCVWCVRACVCVVRACVWVRARVSTCLCIAAPVLRCNAPPHMVCSCVMRNAIRLRCELYSNAIVVCAPCNHATDATRRNHATVQRCNRAPVQPRTGATGQPCRSDTPEETLRRPAWLWRGAPAHADPAAPGVAPRTASTQREVPSCATSAPGLPTSAPGLPTSAPGLPTSAHWKGGGT
jgi:hypothetical protein